jgi:hypothetical protein
MTIEKTTIQDLVIINQLFSEDSRDYFRNYNQVS